MSRYNEFLKNKNHTHNTKYVFCTKDIEIFNSPNNLGAAICILTWFLFIFLKLLHIFFSWKIELFGCHLFVCFMRKFLLKPDSRWASPKIFIGTESLVLVIWKEIFSLSKITWGNRVNYLHLCKSIKSITPMGFFPTHSHRLDVCV